MNMMTENAKMRLISRVKIITLLWMLLALSACGGTDVEPEATPDPMEMQRVYQKPLGNYYIGPGVRLVSETGPRQDLKLASNVYQMPKEALAAARVDDTHMRIPLEGRAYLKNRQAGDIVVASGNGVYWRRITQVQIQDGEVIWETESATMPEVFEDAHFFMQVDLSKVSTDEIPEIDLAMPYLQPHTPPTLLKSRRSALDEDDGNFVEDNCPQAPICVSSEGNDGICVSRLNPNILCPSSGPLGFGPCEVRLGHEAQGCKLRKTDCYITGTEDICPEADLDSCNSPGGACETRIAYAGELADAKQSFDRSHAFGGQPFDLGSFHCEEIAGRHRLIVKSCTETSQCNPLPGGYIDGYTCKKITGPYSGGPAQCEPIGEACTSNAGCCSNNCVNALCEPSTVGYCIDTCAGGESKSEHDASSKLGGLLTTILGGDAGFIQDVEINANFKPTITFELKVNLKGLKLLKLTAGADFYFDLRLKFVFDKNFAKKVEGKDKFLLFSFAVMGYPFNVNLDIHAMAQLSAAMEGIFYPKFGFYTYRSDKMWTEEHDDLGPFPGSHLPYKFDAGSSGSGIEIGAARSNSNYCDNYGEGECHGAGNKWYLIHKFNTDKFFDPGLDVDIDVKAAAELGIGVGLYDGVNVNTRYIGVEPINLLARAYARIQNGFCGLGFNVYYRALLLVGPIKLFGINLIKDSLEVPIIKSQLLKPISFNYRIPDDLDKDCEGADADNWLCILSAELGCGTTQTEPIIPGAEGGACTEHSECAGDGLRCIDHQCLDVQPTGSLRFSLSWTEFKDLNIEVRTPDGKVITRADSNYVDLFAGTCSNPLATGGDAQSSCATTTQYGESLTLGGDGGQLAKGVYVVTVTSAANGGGSGAAQPTGFSLEIEEDGVARRSVQGQFVQDSTVARVPISFEYEVK